MVNKQKIKLIDEQYNLSLDDIPDMHYFCMCGAPVCSEEILSVKKKYKENYYRVVECIHCSEDEKGDDEE